MMPRFTGVCVGLFFLIAQCSYAADITETIEKITDAVTRLCTVPSERGSYWQVNVTGEGKATVKLINIKGQAAFSKGEWDGIRDVLPVEDQAVDRESARKCVQKLVPLFLEKFHEEPSVKGELLEHRIEYMVARLESFVVSGEGEVHIRIALQNADDNEKGLAIALKAQYSDGIADFWKFFPKSEAIVTDEMGNKYDVYKASSLGFARTKEDWTLLSAGETTVLTLSCRKRGRGSGGTKFDISVPIKLVWVPHGTKNQRVSNFEIFFRGVQSTS